MGDSLNKLQRAEKRIKVLKGFYSHVTVYVIVNSCLSTSKIVNNMYNGEAFSEAFWDFSTFAIWFFWGVGLAFHALKVFSLNPFFGKDWEKRQIEKYMEEDMYEEEKYK